jgi:hypothetical protein
MSGIGKRVTSSRTGLKQEAGLKQDGPKRI